MEYSEYRYTEVSRRIHEATLASADKHDTSRLLILKSRCVGSTTACRHQLYCRRQYYHSLTAGEHANDRCLTICHDTVLAEMERKHLADWGCSATQWPVITPANVGNGAMCCGIHISEAAFMPDFAKMLCLAEQTLERDYGICLVESTHNPGNTDFALFYLRSEKGQTRYRTLFLGWQDNVACRRPADDTKWTAHERMLHEAFALDAEQLAWRRWAIGAWFAGDERQFEIEYPLTAHQAFGIA